MNTLDHSILDNKEDIFPAFNCILCFTFMHRIYAQQCLLKEPLNGGDEVGPKRETKLNEYKTHIDQGEINKGERI